jgi:hypothetical protein
MPKQGVYHPTILAIMQYKKLLINHQFFSHAGRGCLAGWVVFFRQDCANRAEYIYFLWQGEIMRA